MTMFLYNTNNQLTMMTRNIIYTKTHSHTKKIEQKVIPIILFVSVFPHLYTLDIEE